MNEKKVSMFELFYDLIFVYAISQLAHTISHLQLNKIDFTDYFLFVLVCIILMQSWMYQTTYINKYGKYSLSDNFGLVFNMIGAIYVAISINTTWYQTFYSFNIGMIIMNCSLIYQFLGESRKTKNDKIIIGELKSFLVLLSASSLLSFLGIVLGYKYGVYLCVFAYLTQAYIPFLFRNKFLPQTLNFPHLIERNSLITIILFGEGIVTIAQLIKKTQIFLLPILFFLLIILLFIIYQYQIEKLVDHHRKTNGIVYMHTHILLSIGILTIISSFNYLARINDKNMSLFMGIILLFQGLVIYYVCLILLSYYNRLEYRLTKKDIFVYISIFLFGLISILAFKDNSYMFTSGVLIVNLLFLVFYLLNNVSKSKL
ncbi:low temperature requirement protein A [Enterococcus faecalis]|uniref:low temperature requirement protein A n=1 Tax=Enterococcus faecalis TaxID=1351 RepID=UPI00045A2605|nr:low temperature requirement protein A [Enterococcus faecalis]KAJ82757.1 putative membrane protein [Enterococcus faecalis NY9]